MSDTNAPEPTMEEILASIRRIISEDDAPAAPADAAPGDPPQPVADVVEPEKHDDVLELTERVEPEPEPEPQPAPVAATPEPRPEPRPAPPPRPVPAGLGDLDFASDAPAPAKPPPPRPAPGSAVSALAEVGADAPLVSHHAADRASDMFGALTSSLSMPASGRTLEDVVRELLRPMLKDWLDQNLPAIVEQRVQDEVERISRRRTY